MHQTNDQPMTMSNNQTNHSNDDVVGGNCDVVPYALLAFAKDKRYMNDLSTLISKCIHNILEDQSDEFYSELNPEINLLVRFIFLFYLLREKKTIGMGYMEIEYESKTLALLPFALMYSFVPYFIERVRTNGWDALKNNILIFLKKTNAPDMNMNDRERLKGEDRRKMFEESRRQMLEGETIKLIKNVPQNSRGMKQNRYISMVWKLMQKVAMVDTSSPRAFEITTSNGLNPQSMQLNRNVTTGANLINTFKWILRFHTALFYASGKYPTLFHRFSGLKIKKSPLADTIVPQRPEFKIIGLLVLFQLGTEVISRITRASIRTILALVDEATFLNERIEAAVPSSISDDANSRRVVSSHQEMMCGICAHPRSFPAAPIGCGHVFCWSCLQHFVSNIRPECPLCRRGTSPQEIILLHNY